jgi:hypothetical protein
MDHFVGPVAEWSMSGADILGRIGIWKGVTASVIAFTEGNRKRLFGATPTNIFLVRIPECGLIRSIFVQRLLVNVRPGVPALPTAVLRDRVHPAAFIGIFGAILMA